MQNISYHLSWKKRSFDIGFSLILLLLLSPVFIGIFLTLLFTSGWPVMFWQKRQGKQKKPFKMLKFRTMHTNAHVIKKKLMKYNEAPLPMFKMQNDPRFTRIGKFLSKTGLDEIPQFFHVLAGQMSMIGPRPLPIEEAKKLPKSWDFRYHVRPGILSVWAVSPDRYKSLKRWQQLELEGLKLSSLKQELALIGQAFGFLLKSNIKPIVHQQLQLQKSKVDTSRRTPVITTQDLPVSSRKARAQVSNFS